MPAALTFSMIFLLLQFSLQAGRVEKRTSPPVDLLQRVGVMDTFIKLTASFVETSPTGAGVGLFIKLNVFFVETLSAV